MRTANIDRVATWIDEGVHAVVRKVPIQRSVTALLWISAFAIVTMAELRAWR